MFDTSGNNGIVGTAIDWKSMDLSMRLVALLEWDISCCSSRVVIIFQQQPVTAWIEDSFLIIILFSFITVEPEKSFDDWGGG